MSKLDEMIRELCPDGVEYKTLGEIAVDIYRGAGITRDQVTAEGTPCVRYGEIYTTYLYNAISGSTSRFKQCWFVVSGILLIAHLPAVAPEIATITQFSGIHFAAEFFTALSVMKHSVLQISRNTTSCVLNQGIFPPS